jgi:hypothetical protein
LKSHFGAVGEGYAFWEPAVERADVSVQAEVAHRAAQRLEVRSCFNYNQRHVGRALLLDHPPNLQRGGIFRDLLSSGRLSLVKGDTHYAEPTSLRASTP